MTVKTIQKVSALFLGLVTGSALAYAAFGYEWWVAIPEGSLRAPMLLLLHIFVFVFSLSALIASSSSDFYEE